MTMTKVRDFYAVVLTNKWFYFSILATVISYVALDQMMRSYAHDYVMFGPTIASFDFPTLRLFFLTFRYSIVFTEIGILCWEWYAPVEVARFPDALPAGTTWEQMYMKFLDDENVTIVAGRYRRNASYVDMGFVDARGKKPSPNAAWNFLKVLAIKNGEIRFPDQEANTTYKKQKQLLSEGLKRYFTLDADPFQPYRSEGSYKIKMTLMASDELRAKLLPHNASDSISPISDIQAEHAKQTPVVHKSKTVDDWLDKQESIRENW
jgi:hypothetical protein